VRNETDAARDVTVEVLAGDESRFAGSFALGPGEDATRTAAVDPAGTLRFRVETDDGRSKTVDWSHCTPNGLLFVSVREQGILVSVRPTPES
jgi:hypothetical protein